MLAWRNRSKLRSQQLLLTLPHVQTAHALSVISMFVRGCDSVPCYAMFAEHIILDTEGAPGIVETPKFGNEAIASLTDSYLVEGKRSCCLFLWLSGRSVYLPHGRV